VPINNPIKKNVGNHYQEINEGAAACMVQSVNASISAVVARLPCM